MGWVEPWSWAGGKRWIWWQQRQGERPTGSRQLTVRVFLRLQLPSPGTSSEESRRSSSRSEKARRGALHFAILVLPSFLPLEWLREDLVRWGFPLELLCAS